MFLGKNRPIAATVVEFGSSPLLRRPWHSCLEWVRREGMNLKGWVREVETLGVKPCSG